MNGKENLAKDAIALDRLVDGELGQEEYAALLRSLDQTPDGWRRCALAFLEAQAWQRELGVRPVERTAATVPEPVQRAAAKKTATWPLLLAVAASFALAFVLGQVFQSVGFWKGPSGVVPPVAERGGAFDVLPGAVERAAREAGLAAAALPDSGDRVTLVVDHGDGRGGRELAVPVYEWADEHEPWLSGGPLAPSSQMRRAVQRGGHDVQMQRHFIPLETGDGRHVLIPVEQMEIRPAARRVFQ